MVAMMFVTVSAAVFEPESAAAMFEAASSLMFEETVLERHFR
jgi:hypothetical protein